MLELFRGFRRQSQEHVQQLARELVQLRGDLKTRFQQVEEECARIRLQRTLFKIHKVAELAIRLGLPAALAIEKGVRALATPLHRSL